MDVSRRIGEWKKSHGVPPLQPQRYKQIVESLEGRANHLGLSKDFVEQVWDLIHKESLREQLEITN
jgi:chorismate mutase